MAAVFESGFNLAVVAAVAAVDDDRALDAIDDVLPPTWCRRPTASTSTSHRRLFRHAPRAGHDPSRRVRLHRAIAERLVDGLVGEPSPAEAAAIAQHYQRSTHLPGADRGVPYALAAADHAAARHLAAEEHAALALALDLIAPTDELACELQARTARAALLAGQDMEVVLAHADVAVRTRAVREGPEAACRLAVELGRLAERIDMTAAWEFGRLVRPYSDHLEPGGESWVQLRSWQLNEAEYLDPHNPGVPLDSPQRRELNARALQLEARQRPVFWTIFPSRQALIDDYSPRAGMPPGLLLASLSGDYRSAETAFARQC